MHWVTPKKKRWPPLGHFDVLDHRHVADYLTSEVLNTLDEQTRGFLLRTSILDRFTATLCDAVLGTQDAASVLTEIESSNLFLVSLDARGAWYRYHHLFGELLRIELAATDPDAVPELHRRAMDWLLANGLLEEALAHAAAVDNHELAKLLAAEHLALIRSGKLDFTKLISHRFTLDQAAEAVHLASNPQPDSMKIVLKP